MKINLKNSKEAYKVKSILKELDIKYSFKWTKKSSSAFGYADCINNKIHVYSSDCTKQEWLSTVFHEIQHILCARKGIYLAYNNGLDPKNLTRKKFNKWARQFLPAERLCDKMGKKMMKKYFPQFKFESFYLDKNGKEYVKIVINSYRDYYGFN